MEGELLNHDISDIRELESLSREELISKIKKLFQEKAELLLEKGLFESIINSFPGLVSVQDSKGNNLFLNSYHSVLDRTDLEKTFGRKVDDLFPQEISDELKRYELENTRNNKLSLFEESLKNIDYKLHTYYVTKFPLKQKKSWSGATCSLSIDITDTIEYERELFESQQFHKSLFENTPFPVWESDFSKIKKKFIELEAKGITDLDEYLNQNQKEFENDLTKIKILRMNRMSTKFFQISVQDNFNYLEQTHLNEQTINTMKKAICSIYKGFISFSDETEIIDKDGIKHIIILNISIFEGYEKSLARVLFSLYDVTDIKEAEKALAEAKEQAELANKTKSEFLANISHEIRTPLNSVIGFSEILLEQISDEKQINYLSTITNSGRSLLSLINNILDISNIDAGKIEILPLPCDLFAILKDMHEVFKPSLEQKGLEFVLKIDKELPMLCLDKTKLNQILLNIFGNAIKFTEKGSIEVTAKLIYKTQEIVDLIIQVLDTGIGIHESKKEYILEAFSKIDHEKKKSAGTGLGLTISKRLIELMGGDLSLESEIGKGSLFTVYLKDIRINCEKEKIPKVEIQNFENMEIQKSSILIVDDISDNRELIKHFLIDEDIRILECNSGEEALKILDNNIPNLILMDLRMDGMDGVETTKQIKKKNSSKNIPVICYTASIYNNPLPEKLSIFDSYLFKPFQKKELLYKLKQFLPSQKIEIQDEFDMEAYSMNVCWNEYLELDIGKKETIKEKIRADLIQQIDDIILFQSPDECHEFSEKLKNIFLKYNLTSWRVLLEKLEKYVVSFDYENMGKLLKNIKNLFIKVVDFRY